MNTLYVYLASVTGSHIFFLCCVNDDAFMCKAFVLSLEVFFTITCMQNHISIIWTNNPADRLTKAYDITIKKDGRSQK